MIAGVCGGFAEYFKMDPTVVRIVFVAASLIISPLLPVAVIGYVVAAIVMPEERADSFNSAQQSQQSPDGVFEEYDFKADREEWKQPAKFDSEKSRIVIGIALVAIGGLFFLKQFFHWFDYKYIIPLILIGIGALIIFKGRRSSV